MMDCTCNMRRGCKMVVKTMMLLLSFSSVAGSVVSYDMDDSLTCGQTVFVGNGVDVQLMALGMRASVLPSTLCPVYLYGDYNLQVRVHTVDISDCKVQLDLYNGQNISGETLQSMTCRTSSNFTGIFASTVPAITVTLTKTDRYACCNYSFVLEIKANGSIGIPDSDNDDTGPSILSGKVLIICGSSFSAIAALALLRLLCNRCRKRTDCVPEELRSTIVHRPDASCPNMTLTTISGAQQSYLTRVASALQSYTAMVFGEPPPYSATLSGEPSFCATTVVGEPPPYAMTVADESLFNATPAVGLGNPPFHATAAAGEPPSYATTISGESQSYATTIADESPSNVTTVAGEFLSTTSTAVGEPSSYPTTVSVSRDPLSHAITADGEPPSYDSVFSFNQQQ